MRRIAPALAAVALFAAMAVLRESGATGAYVAILKAWGFEAYRFPFLDTETVMSALRCVRAGVDVFVANPCDELARVYDYSPLWLAAAIFPVTREWNVPVGLAVDGLFFASLLLLPAGRSRGTTALIVLAAISTAAAYAVERGNNDLVIFALAALAAAAMDWSPRWRLVGYASGLLAGLLKYYPMTLMLLAIRERPARFFGIALASVAVVALFLAIAGHDLVRALALIPHGGYFGDMFGAGTFGGGVAKLLNLPDIVALAIQGAMVAAAMWIGMRSGTGARLGNDIARLSERERNFLLAGAVVVLGCFMTAQNIGYRAVQVVLVVPSLVALAQVGRRRRDYGAVAVMAILLPWFEAIRHWITLATTPLGQGPMVAAQFAAWLMREACWWSVVTFLIACVTALCLRSEMAAWLPGLMSRRRREAAPS